MTEPSSPGGRQYKVGEICRIVGVLPYVLRYWETEFPVLSPERSASVPRLYSERDLQVILAIKKLLYGERYTIAGAKKRLEVELKREGILDAARAEPLRLADPEPVDVSEVALSNAMVLEEVARGVDAKPLSGEEGALFSEPLPESEKDTAEMSAFESLSAGREVDRTPVQVVKRTSPRLELAVAELKEILKILSSPAS